LADNQKLQFLAKVPLFKRLPQDQYPTLASSCEVVNFDPGQVVIKQEDRGNEFFVIQAGEARVMIAKDGAEPKQVAVLKSGDYFGENALLRDEPRNATIIADRPLTTLKITREKFQELGLNEKLEFGKRLALGGGAQKNVLTKAPDPKTPNERKLMENALMNNTNLQTMVPLDENKVTQMIDVAWKETIKAGKNIISEGDLDADYFYIVQQGTFDIQIADSADGGSADKKMNSATHVGTVTDGGSFGELALFYCAPRAATVTAKVDSLVWVIDRTNFKNILARTAEEITKAHAKHLERVDILKELRAEQRMAVAAALVEMSFCKGETVFEEKEDGDTFYILYAGEVAVIKDGKVEAKLSATTSKAQYFGERALLNKEKRQATIKVLSDTAKTLALDRKSFDMLLGPLESLKKGVAKPVSATTTSSPEKEKSGKIRRQDLHKLGLLGCGGFGAVELVEHKNTGETYALKALSKGFIMKSGMQKSVMNEKNIQYQCDTPFIIRLYDTYNSEQTLYFLLELALGGELYATYNRKGFHGRIAHAQFYVAGTLYAFDYLHEKKIIFRDLKPENLLLTDKGNVKLTDMGLAKVVVGKTFTMCGTPDYFAPEIIASTGHTIAVDWWTLGILLFELMSGHPPFESAYPMQTYQKVTKGINKVSFPKNLHGPGEDIVKGLCKKEPSERLPMKKGGVNNMMSHAWYKGFKWDKMKELELEPPYKPVVKSRKDLANFSASTNDLPPRIPYKDDHSGWDNDFASST